jgi:hypothetical protein
MMLEEFKRINKKKYGVKDTKPVIPASPSYLPKNPQKQTKVLTAKLGADFNKQLQELVDGGYKLTSFFPPKSPHLMCVAILSK